MNNKKNFIMIMIGAALAFLSIESSLAISNDFKNNNVTGLYISGQYRPGISNFTNFAVEESFYYGPYNTLLVMLKKNIKNTTDINAAINNTSNFAGLYIAEFQNNIVSFSGAIGYSYSGRSRFEVEGSYEKFNVKDHKNYTIKDAFKYFTLRSEPNRVESGQYVVMKNNGLSIASIMVNSCYDFSFDNLISPYICVGIGEDFIEFFDVLHIKFAYQGKFGINYHLSPKINIFADGYYHKVIGNKFKNLNVHVKALKSSPKVTSASATLNVSYCGGELGVRFTF